MADDARVQTSPAAGALAVFNLDSVEQARLWRRYGSRRATQDLMAALRTALLLGTTVYIDRNQLFDGIFFVAMTPARLRWHLGLEPGAAIPLTVGLFPPLNGLGTVDPASVPRQDWVEYLGVPDAAADLIELNYRSVRDGNFRVSSVAQAMERKDDPDPEGDVFPAAYFPVRAGSDAADPAFVPGLAQRNLGRVGMQKVADDARREWVREMKTGRVAVTVLGSGSLPIGLALEAQQPEIPKGLEKDPLFAQIRDLSDALIDVRIADPSSDERAMECPACGRFHPTHRASVVRWLSGERVPAFDPPTLAESPALADRADLPALDLRRLALRWWTDAYYQAIHGRDRIPMLTMYEDPEEASWIWSRADAGTATLTSDQMRAAEIVWGLRPPTITGLPRLWAKTKAGFARLFRRDQVTPTRSGDDVVAIEGEIITQMRTFTPGQYSRLYDYAHDIDPDGPVGAGDATAPAAPDSRQFRRRKQYDLALAVRDNAVELGGRTLRRWAVLARIVLFTGVGVFLAAQDAGVMSISPWWIALAGFLVAIPWDELLSLFQLTNRGLQSTLRIGKDL